MSGGAANSSGNTVMGSQTSSASGAAKLPHLREFIYLDFPKLTSYFAQIRDGLSEQKSRVHSKSFRDASSTDEVEQNTETVGSMEGQLGDGPIKTLTGLEVSANLERTVGRTFKTGGDETEKTEAEILIETKKLHHNIFRRVEEFLIEHDLIARTLAEDKPFFLIKGKASLLDYDAIIKQLDTFENLTHALKDLNGTDVGNIPKRKSISVIMKHFYQGKVGILVNNAFLTAYAAITSDNLTISAKSVSDNYSRSSSVSMTLFGIRTNTGSAPIRPSSITTPTMGQQLLNINESLDTLEKEFVYPADVIIFPIAVYIDLFEPS